MVIFEKDLPIPVDVSRKFLRAITEAEARLLLSDSELQAESKRTGIDLGMLVNNWRLPPAERWRANYKAAQGLARWDAAACKAGLKA